MTDPNDSIERSVSSITSTWLERARQGNGDAWERLVRTYRGLVCWWAAKSGIQRQDIDDLVQEVFTAVAIAMPGYEHESFRGFLWSITRNKIQDYWRSRYLPNKTKAKSPNAEESATIHVELRVQQEKRASTFKFTGPASHLVTVLSGLKALSENKDE